LLATPHVAIQMPEFSPFKPSSSKTTGGRRMTHRFDGLAEFISKRTRVKLVEMLKNVGLSAEQIAEAVGRHGAVGPAMVKPRGHPPAKLKFR